MHRSLTGFRTGNGSDDRIDLSAFGEDFDIFEEVLAATTQAFLGSRINFGNGDALVLLFTRTSQLSEDDFIF